MHCLQWQIRHHDEIVVFTTHVLLKVLMITIVIKSNGSISMIFLAL